MFYNKLFEMGWTKNRGRIQKNGHGKDDEIAQLKKNSVKAAQD